MKNDLGHAHFLEYTGDGFATLYHQHKFTGFPCGYRIICGPDGCQDSSWLRCPTCGDLGKIVNGAWMGDDGTIPTTLRDAELVMVLPV